MKSRLLIYIAGITCVVVLFVILFQHKPRSLSSGGKPPPEFNQILDEIMSVENVTRPPVPGAAGSTLACVSGNEHGRGLYFVDLKTLKRTPVPTENDVRRVGGWSPDGRHLVFEQKPPGQDNALNSGKGRNLAEDRNESWLTLYDLDKDSYARISAEKGINERFFVWLSTNTYFFSRDSDNNSLRGTYWGKLEDGRTSETKVSDTLHDFVLMSDRKAAYIKEKEIYSFEVQLPEGTNGAVASGTSKKLSNFAAMDFDSIRWLRYQPETGLFLFCSRPGDSNLRFLYQFNPINKELKQLNKEDTYNGQWLEQGAGYAYIGNTNNSFFLALRPKDPSGSTNLFTKGSIANYTVEANGIRLYATASMGIEPQGLWEYDLATRVPRLVVPGASKPFEITKLVEPKELRVKSFDGLEIPYFLFEPVRRPDPVRQGLAAKSKLPLVILIPPPSFQFQRSFEARSQMFANLGFYFAAVNYRGCDGYGKEYASRDDITEGAKDVIAVYKELLKNPEIDRDNVFIWASSYGSMVANELLATAPELWQAVGLGSAVRCEWDKRFEDKKFPAVIMMSGDQDEHLPFLQEFQKQARGAGVEIKLVIKKNASHILYNPDDLKENRRLFVEFFYEHMKP